MTRTPRLLVLALDYWFAGLAIMAGFALLLVAIFGTGAGSAWPRAVIGVLGFSVFWVLIRWRLRP